MLRTASHVDLDCMLSAADVAFVHGVFAHNLLLDPDAANAMLLQCQARTNGLARRKLRNTNERSLLAHSVNEVLIIHAATG